MRKLLLVQLTLIVGFYSDAQSDPYEDKKSSSRELNLSIRVDSFANAQMQKQKIPGLSLAVVRDGKIVHVKGYGYANLEHRVAVKPETIFQSGSVGKQFTAFAIMLLVEDGKIRLEDPLNKYFPDAPASWEKITVKHLLTHTGGWASSPENFDRRADYTEDSLYQIITKIPFNFKAGEQFRYSNAGYVTLGLLISKITGKFYGEFLKQRLFDPLGMNTARIISEADIVLNRAAGYHLVDGEIKNQDWVSPSVNTTADGSLYLTALDMAKWEAALNTGRLLNKESYQLMWSPVTLNSGATHPYGFGWAIDSVNGKQIIHHAGTWQGFQSAIKRYPEKKLAVIVFVNLRGSNPNDIATKILEIYQPELIRPKLKAIKDNEPKVTAFVREFVVKTIGENLTADLFTSEYGPRILSQSKPFALYFKSLGPFIKLELLDHRNKNDLRIYHYRFFFSEEEIELLFTLTRDNKISDFKVRH